MTRVRILLTFKDSFNNAEALHVNSDEFGVLHYQLATGYGHGGTPLAITNLGDKVTSKLPHTIEQTGDGDSTLATFIAGILKNSRKDIEIRYSRAAE